MLSVVDRPAILGGEPVARSRIPFTRIIIGEEEKKAVEEILRSRLFVNGPYTRLLEEEFARYVGVKHAVATSNGTTALFLAYLALGLGFGSRIATTPLTFIATASTILHIGGVPLFADVDEYGNLDPCLVEELEELDAVVVVHLYGLPADMNGFDRISRARNCYIIEDAAHAHGAEFSGRKAGSLGHAATFSFYPSKIIGAGGWGGIVTTNNSDVAYRLRMLRAHGELRVIKGAEGAYEYVMLGYNMRLSEIEAAITYYQLKRLDDLVRKRREAAKILSEMLSEVPGISIPREPPGRKHSYYIYSITIEPQIIGWDRDRFVEALNAEGIDARRGYHIPLHRTTLFKKIHDGAINPFATLIDYPKYSEMRFPNAERLAERTVWLPLYPGLKVETIEAVAKAVRKLVLWGRRRRGLD